MDVSANDSTKTKSTLGLKNFGPGILLASAAIGSSHLVASTQAGALYGWQLAIMIILANFFKYPFFRFGTDYVYQTGDSLITGYAKKSRVYLWVYFIMAIFSAMISIGAIALMTATILGYMLPDGTTLSPLILSIIVLMGSWIILVAGHFRLLNSINKAIVIGLTITTVLSVLFAMGNPVTPAPDFEPISPWTAVGLAFIVQLVGWMPTPLEFVAISSVWTAKTKHSTQSNYRQAILDFNVGYLTSAILALFFLALGVLVQYGTGAEIETKGGQYIVQLIDMYALAIGDWSKMLVAVIAFLCMFGTVLTCADGYGRALAECLSLITHKQSLAQKTIVPWISFGVIGGLALITVFKGQMGMMLKFAMISAFVTAPIFAWLNYSLVKSKQTFKPLYHAYIIAGLIFLLGFTLLFLVNEFVLK